MRDCIIYEIKNKLNGKRYIGSSTRGQKRINEHIRELNKGIHHNNKLQKDWSEFGEDNFNVSLICHLYNEEMLRAYERHLIIEKGTLNEYNQGKF